MESYILHIDTASPRGLVMLSKSGIPVAIKTNAKPTDHAAFVQPAIREIMEETGILKNEIGCIAVANGPGSYTGLRVGLAAAKGLCFAWNIPLLTLSSLHLMAAAMQHHVLDNTEILPKKVLFTPMIDARRMEVFRAVYRHPDLETLIEPGSEIITRDFLAEFLGEYSIFFCGDGAGKWQDICQSEQAIFMEQPAIDIAFSKWAFIGATNNEWANLAYSEPFYSKGFHTVTNVK